MRKIKKFKIAVHHKEIARRLKKAGLDPATAGISGENALREFVSCLASETGPAVVFDAFPSGSEQSKHVTSMPGLAFSAGVVTLGDAIEEKLRSFTADKAAVAKVVLEIFLEGGVRFVLGIIGEEAAREGLELGPIQYLSSPSPYEGVTPSGRVGGAYLSAEAFNAALGELMKKLECPKIGVEWRYPEARLHPEYTAIFSVPWLAKKKSKSSK